MNSAKRFIDGGSLWNAIRMLSWLDYVIDQMPWCLTTDEGWAMDKEYARCLRVLVDAGFELRQVPCWIEGWGEAELIEDGECEGR